MVCLTSHRGFKDFGNNLNNIPVNQVFEYFGTIFAYTHTHTQ
jgi:hypothetical protein